MVVAKHIAFCLCLFGTLLSTSSAEAKVFHSKESALKKAFPGATTVSEKSLFLSTEDAKWIKKSAGVSWPGRVARVYVARDGASIRAYGFIDTHMVRTMNQTVMVVVSASGQVQKSFVIAFHEPEQYAANQRWWNQFDGRRLGPKVSLRRDIDAITGATMTARAGVVMVRRVLALYERKLAQTELTSRR